MQMRADPIGLFISYSASENAELIKNFFFLNSTANISQQNISLLGPLTTNNENITNNRTTVKTYSISPYIRHNFSDFASIASALHT